MRMEVLLAIMGMTLVTYIPRAFPLLILKDKKLGKFLVSWLQFIPVAILSSLLAPAIFQYNGAWFFSISNPFFLAAIPTLLVAVKTRSLMLTTFCGMAAAALLTSLV